MLSTIELKFKIFFYTKNMQKRLQCFFSALSSVCSLPLMLHMAPTTSSNKIRQPLCRLEEVP